MSECTRGKLTFFCGELFGFGSRAGHSVHDMARAHKRLGDRKADEASGTAQQTKSSGIPFYQNIRGYLPNNENFHCSSIAMANEWTRCFICARCENARGDGNLHLTGIV